jgi:hypothetical protein
MKQMTINKKLNLSKVTISQLTEKTMRNAIGRGTEYPWCYWTEYPCYPSVLVCPIYTDPTC